MAIIWVRAHEVRKDGPLALIVPMAIRRALGLGKGQQFAAEVDGKTIVYTPVPTVSHEE